MSSVNKAEQYLVQVVKKNNISVTFDDLRYWTNHFTNAVSVNELPPTSQSIRLHILRALYITYYQINLLQSNIEQLDPLKFGYIIEENCLIPAKIHILYPTIDELPPKCNCKKCSTKQCSCKSSGVPCISFCVCKSLDITCNNLF